ncbi:hypothetical protein EDC01DRAFT_761970 [Geopyxis carbonaria]|nr:hypothetical protein EDC01DRAFT_761970 [Geopyxis carbonaria]
MVHVPPTTPVPSMTFRAPSAPALPPPPSANPALTRFSLAWRRCVITGGAGGLALSAARALLEHGASRLALLDLHGPSLAAAAAALAADFPQARVLPFALCITDDAAVARTVGEVVDAFGGIDVLLCFAGVVQATPALEHSPAQFRRVLDVNTTGSFLVAQAVVAARVAAQAAQVPQHVLDPQNIGLAIVLIASISGHLVNFPQPQVAYNASKAAVISLARNLAAEWAVHGVRVNSISPGYMDTVLNVGGCLDEHRRVWKERTPLGRMGGRHELDGAVVLLAGPAGSFITGADLRVDGGIGVL